ncbi:MAG: hypothetical protein QY317_16220 [Candidatus Jettenia caeni]|nr:MAG: hypothetical protein QY317_16220 [Candidatus Jettenia caeni]
MEFKVSFDIQKFVNKMSDLEKKHVPWAVKETVNHVASIIYKKTKEAIPPAFQDPTPLTLDSVFVRPAEVDSAKAFAYVGFKDWLTKGIAPNKYLAPSVYGGDRNKKRSEASLERKGLLKSDEYLAPGKGLRLNQYGNVSGPTMVQILSAVGGFTESGYLMNRSYRSVKRNKKLRPFAIMDPPGKPPRGIYERYGQTHEHTYKTGRKKGQTIMTLPRKVKPSLIFVRKPMYKKRLEFYEICEKYSKLTEKIFHEKMIKAITNGK